ncbi:hypothetical protein LINPERPRIM_LOCUS19831 [Linum perenne]
MVLIFAEGRITLEANMYEDGGVVCAKAQINPPEHMAIPDDVVVSSSSSVIIIPSQQSTAISAEEVSFNRMRDHSNQMVQSTLQTFTIDKHTYFAYGRFVDTLITFLLGPAHLLHGFNINLEKVGFIGFGVVDNGLSREDDCRRLANTLNDLFINKYMAAFTWKIKRHDLIYTDQDVQCWTTMVDPPRAMIRPVVQSSCTVIVVPTNTEAELRVENAAFERMSTMDNQMVPNVLQKFTAGHYTYFTYDKFEVTLDSFFQNISHRNSNVFLVFI